jgi:hypothetical protein
MVKTLRRNPHFVMKISVTHYRTNEKKTCGGFADYVSFPRAKIFPEDFVIIN